MGRPVKRLARCLKRRRDSSGRPGIPVTREVESRYLMRRQRTRKPDGHALRGLRVVVVDDETDAREWLRTMLEQFGRASPPSSRQRRPSTHSTR